MEPRFRELPVCSQTCKNLAGSGGWLPPRAHASPLGGWASGRLRLSSFSAVKTLAGTTGWNSPAYTADPSGLSTGNLAPIAVSLLSAAREGPGERRAPALE